MNNETIIRFLVGPLMIVLIYTLMTFLTGLPFESGLIVMVVIAYIFYTYFRHGRRPKS